MLDLIIKNGTCYLDGKLKKIDMSTIADKINVNKKIYVYFAMFTEAYITYGILIDVLLPFHC